MGPFGIREESIGGGSSRKDGIYIPQYRAYLYLPQPAVIRNIVKHLRDTIAKEEISSDVLLNPTSTHQITLFID